MRKNVHLQFAMQMCPVTHSDCQPAHFASLTGDRSTMYLKSGMHGVQSCIEHASVLMRPLHVQGTHQVFSSLCCGLGRLKFVGHLLGLACPCLQLVNHHLHVPARVMPVSCCDTRWKQLTSMLPTCQSPLACPCMCHATVAVS